jgi:hypothetical protein
LWMFVDFAVLIARYHREDPSCTTHRCTTWSL